MPFDFGSRLQQLRKKKKLSHVLIQMALLYGVSTDYLTGLDNRKLVSLEGFTENQQKLVMGIMDLLRMLIGSSSAEGRNRQEP